MFYGKAHLDFVVKISEHLHPLTIHLRITPQETQRFREALIMIKRFRLTTYHLTGELQMNQSHFILSVNGFSKAWSIAFASALTTLLALTFCNTLFAAGTETETPAPSAQSYYDDAKKSLTTNKWKPALASLQKAVQLDPNNADIHNLLGYSYRKAGNLDKAFEHYGIALKLNPKHIGAHEYLGETYLLAKDLPNAEKHLTQLEGLCGKSCEEYNDLAKAIAEYKARK